MRLSIFLLLSIFIGCKSNHSLKNIQDEDPLFYLAKGACFGQCPVFQMTIQANGKAIYKGMNYTNKVGTYTKTLDRKEMDRLITLFTETNFEKYQTVYPNQIPDLPEIKVGFHVGDTLKVVSGKMERPESLKQLQFELEKVADAEGWTVIEKGAAVDVNRSDNDGTIYDEIIIEPHAGVVLKNWLENKSSTGVRLLRKIAPNQNLYLITFDTDRIAPKAFMEILKADDQIKSASFNKLLDQRDQPQGRN